LINATGTGEFLYRRQYGMIPQAPEFDIMQKYVAVTPVGTIRFSVYDRIRAGNEEEDVRIQVYYLLNRPQNSTLLDNIKPEELLKEESPRHYSRSLNLKCFPIIAAVSMNSVTMKGSGNISTVIGNTPGISGRSSVSTNILPRPYRIPARRSGTNRKTAGSGVS